MSRKEQYWDVISEIEQIQNDCTKHNVQVPIEAINIRTLAIIELIRNGEDFQISSNQEEIDNAKKKAESGFLKKDIVIPELKETLCIKDETNKIHKISTYDIKEILKAEYPSLILHIDNEKEQQNNESKALEMPDIKFEKEEKPKQVEQDPITKEEVTEAPKDNEFRIPSFKGNMRLPHDEAGSKKLDSMYFAKTDVNIDVGSGENVRITFIAYPLKFEEDSPVTDIFVIASSFPDGDNSIPIIRTGVSRGMTSSIQLDFKEFSFMVRGLWEHSEFKCQVTSLNEQYKKRTKQNTQVHIPERKTFTPYAQSTYEDKVYNIFPGEISENSIKGYSVFAAVIVENGKLNIMTPNPDGKINLVTKDGFITSLSTYWHGGIDAEYFINFDE